MNLFLNSIQNYTNLKNDFIGISFSAAGIGEVVLNILFTLILFFIYYLFGRKFISIFFKNYNNKSLSFVLNSAVGYIFLNTGIAILGAASLLNARFILLYIFLSVLVSLYSFENFKAYSGSIRSTKKLVATFWKRYPWICFGVTLFVFIAFLRLLLPETAEDAVGYHNDLPMKYLQSRSLMIDPAHPQHVATYPQLAEMSYLIAQFFSLKDATRYIHFGFYILILITLLSIYIYSKGLTKFSLILFATTPVIIRYSSSAYTDFPMLLCWIITILLISEKKLNLAGVVFGGVLATKLWTLIYFPAILAFIWLFDKDEKATGNIKKISLFILIAVTVPSIWYIRSYILTGNPFFPVLSNPQPLEVDVTLEPITIANYIGFNTGMFSFPNLIVLSPLFFLGILNCLKNLSRIKIFIQNFPIGVFFLILTFEQLFIKVFLGRHILAWYVIAIIVSSYGIELFLKKYRFSKYIVAIGFTTIFLYYFINTIINLPYAFGWADQNKYLTRILSRDNSSYYDFDHKFSRWIGKNDVVATYGIFGFYYADFLYIDVYNIFDTSYRSFDALKEKGATKLFIKGGDVLWFCTRLGIDNCTSDKYSLIEVYESVPRYLYELN